MQGKNELTREEIFTWIEENIVTHYHNRRLTQLNKLDIFKLVTHNNPYKCRGHNFTDVRAIVEHMMVAHITGYDTSLYGEFLERLAIFICSRKYNGMKATIRGVDIDMMKDGIRYLISLKSGINWANGGTYRAQRAAFAEAKKILATNTDRIQTVCIIGCCYGRDNKPDKGDFLRLCGEEFWTFISDDPELYIDIIIPMGNIAVSHNDMYNNAYDAVVDKFTTLFETNFCENGIIMWDRIVRCVSAKRFEKIIECHEKDAEAGWDCVTAHMNIYGSSGNEITSQIDKWL